MFKLAKIFDAYKDSPIALYGLGTETEKALVDLKQFHIVGLLDSFRVDGNLYGHRIIPLEDCVKEGVKAIIVVARPGSCRAISKKIGGFCVDHKIALIDIRGKNLCVQNKVAYNFNDVGEMTKKQIRKLASEADTVSFDLFDTLITRRVAEPTDIIKLLEWRLNRQGIFIDNFYEKRIKAEKELSKDKAPFLEEIYQMVLKESEPVNVTAEELAEKEWEIDDQMIVPRYAMADFFSELYTQGKKVYIVTDTYYRKKQLIKMLKKCGILEFTDIIPSCEFGTGKAGNLFAELKRIAGGNQYLHIGDDPISDIGGAGRHGISTCRIYSGLDLFEMLGYLGMWEYMDSLEARLKIGMFVAKIINSPFQFEKEERKLCAGSAYEIGYFFMAPMITDFTIWFYQKIKEYHIQNVWFGARDGYLIQKLYNMIEESNCSVYFLTSRMAAIRAGIENREDIEYVTGMKYGGTMQQQLKERFGLTVKAEDTKGKDFMDFARDILKRADLYRKNYKKYIAGLKMDQGEIAFFDFVAKGTTQMYLGRIVSNHIKGLYFLQLEKSYMANKGLDIETFYADSESQTGAVYEDYYILETILTSDHASVLDFDENGAAVFAEETRRKEDIDCLKEVQEGIMDYFKTYIQILPDTQKSEINKDIDEMFLEMIHKFNILDQSFLNLKVEDPFFNRTTDILDLI